MKKIFSNLLVFLFLLISITSVEGWSSISLAPTLTSTLIISVLYVIILALGFNLFKNPLNKNKKGAVSLFLFLIVITGIRSILIASGKEQWEFLLMYLPAMLSFICIYYFDNLFLFRKLNYFWFRLAPILCLLWYPFMSSKGEAIGFFLPLLLLYLLFINVIPKKSKVILLVLTFLIMFICFKEGARSHVLKFGIAMLFGFSLYFKAGWFYLKLIKFGRIFFLLIPIVLFSLGITNVFNVFKMDEYISGDYSFERIDTYGNQNEESLVDDTRTFLYEEAVVSAVKNEYVIFGRSFARGYDSFFQVRRSEKAGKVILSDTAERISEVAIINIFTWMGIIGVIVYFFVFVKVTSLAIYHSNNSYIKIAGLYLSFRWMYGWVEDFQGLNISTLTMWMLIAICVSKNFRSLNNYHIKKYMFSIFIR